MCRGTRVVLPAVPASAGVARDWVREQLRSAYRSDLGPVGDDAALVVTELISNATRTRADHVVVELEAHAGELRVAVTDEGGGVPAARVPATGESSGRGLTIVAAVSLTWGVSMRTSTPGKTVWAELGPVHSSGPPFACRRRPPPHD